MAGLIESLLCSANRHPRPMLLAACAAMAMPLVRLGLDWHGDALGVNPLETLLHTTGTWAFILLLAAMTLGPARRALVRLAILYRCGYGKRLPDWNWLLRLRRPIGLAAYFYATLHFVLYVWFDLGMDWHTGLRELVSEPFLLTGTLALLLLAPLAITSTDSWVRRLKRNWKTLHMLVYPAAGLTLMHVILLSKPGVPLPYSYGSVLAVLLGYRVLQRRAFDLAPQERADGAMPERPLTQTSEQAARRSLPY